MTDTREAPELERLAGMAEAEARDIEEEDIPITRAQRNADGSVRDREIRDYEQRAADWRRIASILRASAWRPIEEAPRDGTPVLAIAKNAAGFWTHPVVVRWTREVGWSSHVSSMLEPEPVYHPPTLFQPLPKWSARPSPSNSRR